MFPTLAPPAEAPPRCRSCRKLLDKSRDRKKTRDGWWTNCQSCSDRHAAEWRQKRDAGVLKPKLNKSRRSADLEARSFSVEWWKRYREKARCGECNRRPYKPWATGCRHIICSEPCYEDIMHAAAEKGLTYGTCRTCGEKFYICTPLFEDDYEPERLSETASIPNTLRSQLGEVSAFIECSVCGEVASRVELSRLLACKHDPDVCKECFAGWLESQLGSTSWEKVQCPSNGCDQPITHEDVKKHASPELFARYVRDYDNEYPSLTLTPVLTSSPWSPYSVPTPTSVTASPKVANPVKSMTIAQKATSFAAMPANSAFAQYIVFPFTPARLVLSTMSAVVRRKSSVGRKMRKDKSRIK